MRRSVRTPVLRLLYTNPSVFLLRLLFLPHTLFFRFARVKVKAPAVVVACPRHPWLPRFLVTPFDFAVSRSRDTYLGKDDRRIRARRAIKHPDALIERLC